MFFTTDLIFHDPRSTAYDDIHVRYTQLTQTYNVMVAEKAISKL